MKQYFDGTERYVGTMDRYGNTIKFTYRGNEGITITDTRGKEIKINYGSNTTEIVLPDSGTILYTFKLKKLGRNDTVWILTSKRDQMGKETKYIYNVFSFGGTAPTECNLTEIEFPTGMKCVYTYETGNQVGSANNRYSRISERKYISDGKEYNKETYTYSELNYTGVVSQWMSKLKRMNITHVYRMKKG